MGAREKLALFNMIAEYLPGAMVLDAFAGSGALGIEALSRGAESVVFVEKSPSAANTIKSNLAELNLTDCTDVIISDIAKLRVEKRFDVVLVDPPYDKFNIDEVTILPKFLAGNGVLVLSHPGEAPKLSGLQLLKTHQYASAKISIYEK